MNIRHRFSAPIVAVTLLVAGAVTSASTAHAAAMSPSLENRLVAVCEAIKGNNRLALLKAVKKSGVSYRALAKGLVCNGQDIYTFAMLHNAQKTGALIAKRTRLADNTLTAKR